MHSGRRDGHRLRLAALATCAAGHGLGILNSLDHPLTKRPRKGRFHMWPARRDERRLRLAGLAAIAARLELGSSNPLDHPHTKTPPSGGAFICGPPGEIRTPDTQVRSLVLYPAELRAEARSLGTVVQKVKNRCNLEQFRSLRSPPNRIEEHQNQRHYQCAEVKTLTGRKTHA